MLWKKEQTINKNRDKFESFERWMTERRIRFYVPWGWYSILQKARFVRQDKKSTVFSLFWSQTTFSTDDPTTLRLTLEYMSEHMDARYSHLFPSMSTHWFQQWRILKGNRERNHLMATQMLTKYLNRGRISYLMAYTLSAKKQQYSLISINSHDKWIKG